MRLAASIEPEYLQLVMKHMPGNDAYLKAKTMPYYPKKEIGDQQLFRIDPELKNAFDDQKAFGHFGMMGGPTTYA
tara:strand:+ start:9554 stop:9778 length:225 start_codon:yes stop_codon:yes gene_type:complete